MDTLVFGRSGEGRRAMVSAGRRVSGVLVLAVILGCGGCALPSDPVLPPVAIRVDAGVIELALPVCPGEVLERAKVTAFSADRVPDRSWRGERFTGVPTGIVRLDAGSWEQASGSYATLTALDVEVETERRITGLAVDDVSDLRAGDEFDVDGRSMSLPEYRIMIASQIDCG